MARTNGDPNVDGFLNGKYEDTKLRPGEQIDRYGGNNGTFLEMRELQFRKGQWLQIRIFQNTISM